MVGDNVYTCRIVGKKMQANREWVLFWTVLWPFYFSTLLSDGELLRFYQRISHVFLL